MGIGEGESKRPSKESEIEANVGKPLPQELSNLLEAVLQETTGSENRESLNLVTRVARNSRFEQANTLEAIEELVREIVDAKFGKNKLSARLVRNIASSLLETPEAMNRISRLWQEARDS